MYNINYLLLSYVRSIPHPPQRFLHGKYTNLGCLTKPLARGATVDLALNSVSLLMKKTIILMNLPSIKSWTQPNFIP